MLSKLIYKMPLLILVIISIFVSCIYPVRGELFTAQVELESLLSTQQSIVEAVEIYLANEDIRLQEIRRRLVPFTERGRKDPHDVVANPISAFLLVKGLSVDLEDLLSAAADKSNSNRLAESMVEIKSKHSFPTSEDLNGAAAALTRLHDTYLLDTSAMARGDLNGHCCADILNSDALFELGRLNYNQGDFEHTVLWMNEALNRVEEEQQNITINTGVSFPSTADILEYLAFSTYQKGEISHAITLTEQLLRLEPNHPRAIGNVAHYQKLLDDRKGEDGRQSDQSMTAKERRVEKVGWEKEKYESLCRGESQAVQKRAKCRYYHGGNAYLLIGPFKQEVIFLKPRIHIYYDVMFDDEIEIIKHLAIPRFKRATVHNHATGELVVAQYRISKSAWLQSEEHAIVDKVNKRISAITGLELKTAEELQVVNYGLGGHYEPHYDFARRDEKDAFKSLGTGNRIATFLFYMSDVEAGGATVFPSIDLTLFPKKGAAAFWYNLFEDGNGDFSTRHAACPVLLGTKWVSNKWIHERGQEFLRPCKLQPSAGE